jgi:translin
VCGERSLSSLKTVLNKVKKELMQKDKVRENTHESMRKATSLSKQAILRIHQKKFDEAKKLLENATAAISQLQSSAETYPEIIYGGMFSAALQEYAEANIFLKLIEESRFVSPKEINVPAVDYVLGLADAIGEYRRLTLDALREGNVAKGEKCLELMDEMYVELMGMDEAYVLVPGLRRKCDVARKIIEITRGDITQEVRRKALEDYLKRFEQAQAKKRQPRKGPH